MGKTVEERLVSIDELIDANNKGLLQDAFGSEPPQQLPPLLKLVIKTPTILYCPWENASTQNY